MPVCVLRTGREVAHGIGDEFIQMEKVLNISASTIDRLLAGEQKKLQVKGRARTRPGTLLKNQIPVRTFGSLE